MTSFNLCSSYAIIRKAGVNANSTIIASNAALSDWCDQAEAEITTATKYDWVTNYSTINQNTKAILTAATSARAAIAVINYDMSGYTSRSEAQTMLDVLRDEYTRALEILKDNDSRSKMGGS